MKKTAIVLVITLVSSANNAFYGSQLIQKEHNQEYEQPLTIVPVDEYNTLDEYINTSNEANQAINQTDVDEYDQHVSDEAQAPKISAAEALIKEMLGFVLIQYLTIKEIAHVYCQEIKDVFQQWFGVFTKAIRK